jgi:hypothetical protein
VKRYRHSVLLGMVAHPDGPWMNRFDAEERIAQLERVLLGLLGNNCMPPHLKEEIRAEAFGCNCGAEPWCHYFESWNDTCRYCGSIKLSSQSQNSGDE